MTSATATQVKKTVKPTRRRLDGYLYRVTSPRAEDVVDEMLAILSDRKAWIEKKQSEEAQAAISRMYREGL